MRLISFVDIRISVWLIHTFFTFIAISIWFYLLGSAQSPIQFETDEVLSFIFITKCETKVFFYKSFVNQSHSFVNYNLKIIINLELVLRFDPRAQRIFDLGSRQSRAHHWSHRQNSPDYFESVEIHWLGHHRVLAHCTVFRKKAKISKNKEGICSELSECIA